MRSPRFRRWARRALQGQGNPRGLPASAVGTVLRVIRTDSAEYYVALAGGLQRVGRLTVDLLRFADPAAGNDIREVPPELVARTPLVDALPVATYPDEPPSLLNVGEELCATWQSGRSGIAIGPSAADGHESVALAGSDGDGPGIDIVRMTPGRSLDVTDPGAGARYLVTDAGVRFPVRDSATAALGLTEAPAAAPWAILGALPDGPELARDAALVRRDVLRVGAVAGRKPLRSDRPGTAPRRSPRPHRDGAVGDRSARAEPVDVTRPATVTPSGHSTRPAGRRHRYRPRHSIHRLGGARWSRCGS